MITADDASFHPPQGYDPSWAETNYFGFYVPEVPLNGGVYALFRPSLGVALSTVNLNTRWAEVPWAADYWDSQAHLVIPPGTDLRDYRLDNGLRVRALDPPMGYRLDFDDGEGTEVHFTFRGLMPPFDIHDPEMDPMAASGDGGHDFSWGTAYNGHFDHTGKVEGEIVLGGRRISVDCVSTMDHSWGPRPERHAQTMSWLHAHFSPELAVHAIFDFDPTTGGRDLRLTHGYVLEAGEVCGLSEGRGRTDRRGRYPDHVSLDLVDRRGRPWSLEGRALTAFPWQAWPDVVGFNSLLRWTCGGMTGHGEAQDFFGVQTLCEQARAGAPFSPPPLAGGGPRRGEGG